MFFWSPDNGPSSPIRTVPPALGAPDATSVSSPAYSATPSPISSAALVLDLMVAVPRRLRTRPPVGGRYDSRTVFACELSAHSPKGREVDDEREQHVGLESIGDETIGLCCRDGGGGPFGPSHLRRGIPHDAGYRTPPVRTPWRSVSTMVATRLMRSTNFS